MQETQGGPGARAPGGREPCRDAPRRQWERGEGCFCGPHAADSPEQSRGPNLPAEGLKSKGPLPALGTVLPRQRA